MCLPKPNECNHMSLHVLVVWLAAFSGTWYVVIISGNHKVQLGLMATIYWTFPSLARWKGLWIHIERSLERKTTKYQPFINNIITRGWNVVPHSVLVAGARATTHTPSMNKLEEKLKLPVMKIKSTFKQINIIVTQYAHSILVHKCRLENQQPVIDLQDLT